MGIPGKEWDNIYMVIDIIIDTYKDRKAGNANIEKGDSEARGQVASEIRPWDNDVAVQRNMSNYRW